MFTISMCALQLCVLTDVHYTTVNSYANMQSHNSLRDLGEIKAILMLCCKIIQCNAIPLLSIYSMTIMF